MYNNNDNKNNLKPVRLKRTKLLTTHYKLKYVYKSIILLNEIYIIFQIMYKPSYTLLSCLFLL